MCKKRGITRRCTIWRESREILRQPRCVCVCVCEGSSGCSVRSRRNWFKLQRYTNVVLANAATNLLRSCLFLSQPKNSSHFITVFTIATLILLPLSYKFSSRCILILFFHPRLQLPNGFCLSGFSTKTCYTFLFSAIRTTHPVHLILPR